MIIDTMAYFLLKRVRINLLNGYYPSNLCANKIPHITICTFRGGMPKDSNNITEWKDIEPITVEVKLEKR